MIFSFTWILPYWLKVLHTSLSFQVCGVCLPLGMGRLFHFSQFSNPWFPVFPKFWKEQWTECWNLEISIPLFFTPALQTFGHEDFTPILNSLQYNKLIGSKSGGFTTIQLERKLVSQSGWDRKELKTRPVSAANCFLLKLPHPYDKFLHSLGG